MKIIFAGTPPFAACALEALIEAGHDICLVLSQPDRPSGRGMKLTPSAVKALALQNNIPVRTPSTLSVKKDPQTAQETLDLLTSLRADVMVVAAYGMLLPESVLAIPQGIGPDHSVKCINIHASLLPRWRGAAPITRAIESGDRSFGVTLMKMDAGLDTGDMLLSESTPITPTTTAGQLHDKLSQIGAKLIIEALDRRPTAVHQPAQGRKC